MVTDISLAELIIYGLAVWRISSLLVSEDGPYNIFGRLRSILGVRYDEYSVPYGENIIGEQLACIWCTSLWTGLMWTMIYYIYSPFVLFISLPLAFSAICAIIHGRGIRFRKL